MRRFNQREAGEAATALVAWFKTAMRPLPWRRNYHPYEVWISEVMLQQTQMERGVDYFLRWMKRFPDVTAVAAAPEEDILHAWEGLGYYRRARFLHAAAKAMVERHGGLVPEDAAALAALPGLGTYTVAAIRGIAFNQDVVVVDANVERVFSRLLDVDMPPKKREAARVIREEAASMLPPGHARDYNQALMELGALVCRKTPQCAECPLIAWCEARRLGVERERPVLEARAAIVPVTTGHGVLVHEDRALLVKRPDNGVWGGLWEFPGGEIEEGETPSQAVKRVFAARLGLAVQVEADLGTVRHGYTNHRLTAHFFRVKPLPGASWPAGADDVRLVDCRKTDGLAMPAHHRKLADRYFGGKRRRGDNTQEQLTLT